MVICYTSRKKLVQLAKWLVSPFLDALCNLGTLQEPRDTSGTPVLRGLIVLDSY